MFVTIACRADRSRRRWQRPLWRLCLAASLTAPGWWPALAGAGGGPLTTVVVVNADSPLSLAVANEYVRLRDIPGSHVLALTGIPVTEGMTVERFRTAILAPLRDFIAEAGLDERVDLVAYSSGFPYAVDFREDARKAGFKLNRLFGVEGSLTGLTYFHRLVDQGKVDYLRQDGNRYFRLPTAFESPPRAVPALPGDPPRPSVNVSTFEPARGFRSRYRWVRDFQDLPRIEARYMLSAMLGYTGVRGNSLPEVRAYLQRAAGSDGVAPDGTVYLMENDNVRSLTRQPHFDSAITALERRGRRVRVLGKQVPGQNGREPVGRDDIIGLVAGSEYLDLEGSGSGFLPGAFGEALTSYAGAFQVAKQTKVSALLRAGAAGSSGAVAEPYALAEKFPLPIFHAHYADGCSLAEAYYQSVAMPYQLLLVGDPLAQPFAQFVAPVIGLPAGGVVRGAMRLPVGLASGWAGIERVELWVDGRWVDERPPGVDFEIDTTVLADGAHRLAVVAVGRSAIETQSSASAILTVANHPPRLGIADWPERVAYDASLAIEGSVAAPAQLRLLQGNRVLASTRAAPGSWQLTTDAARLGEGRVELQVEARFRDGRVERSPFLPLEVVSPALVSGSREAPTTSPGLMLTTVAEDGGRERHQLAALLPGHFHAIRIGGMKELTVEAMVEVRVSGLYEFTLQAEGRAEVRFGRDWSARAAMSREMGGARFAVPLQAGWHQLHIRIDAPASRTMAATLAGPEPGFALEGDRVRIVAD